MEISINIFFGRITALRGVTFKNVYNLNVQLRTPRFLRSVHLVLHPNNTLIKTS